MWRLYEKLNFILKLTGKFRYKNNHVNTLLNLNITVCFLFYILKTYYILNELNVSRYYDNM